jgi:hypothetical protein
VEGLAARGGPIGVRTGRWQRAGWELAGAGQVVADLDELAAKDRRIFEAGFGVDALR